MRAESSLWDRVTMFLNRDLWSPQETARRGVAWTRSTLQLTVLIAEQSVQHQILLRASALTYYSMLSIVPLLAIALAVIKALGVSENLAQLIVDRVATGNPEAGEWLLGIVTRVDFGALGTLGAALLFLTTVLGISSIERSLNTIWGVTHERPWERRLPDYLAVLIVAPLLLGMALSLGATLQSQTLLRSLLELDWFAAVWGAGLQQLPLAFLCLGFAFLYWFLPNTRVRTGPALLGGLVAAVLFTGAERIYVGFHVGEGRANVLFQGFAFLPLLLVWIYVSWVIALFGAEVAYAIQNLAIVRRARQGEEPGPATREALGLAIAANFARLFRDGRSADAQDLADELEVAARSVNEILGDLERAGIVARRGGLRGGYQLGRAADRIRVAEVLRALRGGRGSAPQLGVGRAVGELLGELDRQGGHVLGDRTLADLARAGDDPGRDSDALDRS